MTMQPVWVPFSLSVKGGGSHSLDPSACLRASSHLCLLSPMATLAHVRLRSTLCSENREVISTGQEVEAENSQGHRMRVCVCGGG